MLCQKCHKNLATIRYAEVVDGKVTDLNVCSDCLSRLRNMATGFELAGAAPSPKRPITLRETGETAVPAVVCRSCGTQLQQALNAGKLGCSACYTQFGDALDSVLRSMHGALRHRGKTPHVDDAREQVRAQLQNKRALLRSSLRTENYEAAATLRDEIKALEEGLGIPASGHD